VRTLSIGVAAPQAARLQFPSLKIKTRQFAFQTQRPPFVLKSYDQEENVARRATSIAPAAGSESTATGDSVTRITPPSDVIKLDDRLFYLLQPPLESLLTGASLRMPFVPFPYQLSGISFLFPRHAAVLADEMGLGKTMQAITTIRLLLHAGQLRDVLLVCPKPLVTNWQREFALWAPEIPICVVEGDQARRRWLWNLPDVPVKISNYEALLRDRDEVCEAGRHFDLLVLDEAQRIKNRSSSSHELICSISRTRSWALTGTPVENSPDDLVGIFDFLVPGFLTLGMSPRRLREATRDYIIRRTKDQVLTEMPPKLYRDAFVQLTPEQQLSYHRAENDGVVHLKDLGEAISIQHVFELVLRLKQICNFDPETGKSAKLDRLEADLEEVAASGKKAIVFSQWVGALCELRKRLHRFGTVEYHGRIPSKNRDGVIEQLRNDPKTHVILMSYGAGSVGLNLQFCEYVFLFDRWWNPAIEDQAINRAHRIGAAGPVTVTRFVTADSIEQRIDQILTQKREIFETILAGTDMPQGSGLSQADIFGLFDLQIPGGRLKLSEAA
jgi:SNF2 family DNA or RNA helicase